MEVREIMRQAFIIADDISLKEAAKIMSTKEIGSLIYISKGKVQGIITERDIIKNFDSKEKVSRIMTTKVITISPDEDIDEAFKLMSKNKIKRLPVVENEKLLGIITLTDIAAHVDELQEEFFFD